MHTTILNSQQSSTADQLLSKLPGLITVHDNQTGAYSFVSPAVQRILGYSVKTYREGGIKFAMSLVHPDDLPIIYQQHTAALRAVTKQKPLKEGSLLVSFDYRIRHKRGHWVWLHTDVTVNQTNQKGEPTEMLNVSVDISERKKTEAKLLARSQELEKQLVRRNERLALALDASQLGTWEWSVTSDDLVWSDRLYRMFGLNPRKDKISYQKYQSLLHPDDRPKVQKAIKSAMKSGKTYTIEHRCIWPDGSMHWLRGSGRAILENGQPVFMLGTTLDIDQHKETMQRLEQTQTLYRALFDSNAIGVYLHNKDGVITESNKTFLNMIGYTRSDLKKGKLIISELTPPEYAEVDAQKMHELYTRGEASPWEKEYICKDGHRLPLLLGKVVVPHSDGKFIAIVIDTTDQQELIALNNAKDDFISLASHQLRTPATGVKQYIGMLLEGFAGKITDPSQRLMLMTAYENNERQLTIIDDLLKVANVDAGKVKLRMETADLIQLLRETIQDQIIKFKERKQKVRFLHDDDLLPVFMDRQRLRMVIENIIDNASKYTASNRQITVLARTVDDQVVIDVRDQGVGIHKKDLDKLFQKFSRIENPLSREVGGTGLGLYWAKSIVDLHNGSIGVQSRPGKGSTFRITLPRG